tara:strand:- start:503 stop:784 length:282 start_codon:yes stop_codon:yes gene_type:complete
MKSIVESLDSRIKKLISLYENLKQLNERTLEENDKLNKEVDEKAKFVKELEEKIKLIKISKLAVSLDEDNKKIKQKINEYVREIDKCVALLNK